MLQDPQCRYIYIHTLYIYICILYTSYIYHIYVYTVHPTCLCMNISTAYIRGKMFPSRQTSRHWHWGRTQKNPIGSREVIYIYTYIYPCKVPLKLHTICTVFIWMYVYICIYIYLYTYCTYLYYAHSFEHKSTKCKHTYRPSTARFSWTILSQSILFHISMCFFPGCHVVHVWTNHFFKQSLGGGSGFILFLCSSLFWEMIQFE